MKWSRSGFLQLLKSCLAVNMARMHTRARTRARVAGSA